MIIAIAPGGPGSRPTWTSSAKDMVTTALGTSRVWVTLGYGILNEVYWPATGLPQIRDLGFIVAGPSEWFEVKRVNRYHVSMPDDWSHYRRSRTKATATGCSSKCLPILANQINDQIKLGGLLNGQIGRLGSTQDLV